ncbi:cytochrome c biogenesis protein CcsA [Pullulanibacillus sp. KACC 23026]|uniref:cytochrome c biogenesis protein CcsA n=1 Tax=Pullulanibacillus sp. KACC 23026 TaxID=3028315 RepID=UPI0023AE80D4|nr:cytochrome c biogenesis protein CcsA [Pullulanibacillus sp. KACC 23026]WEG14037.1 cytochrome c biogenesis protein CcsA [Pullulanibacillus sp. KACC 23026]
MAFWLLSIVWVLQVGIFFLKYEELGEFPIVTLTDGLFFLTWFLVTVTLVLDRFYELDLIISFSNLAGFILMAISLFKPDRRAPELINSHLMSDLLIIHITIALIAYAFFTLSFVLSMMYMVEYSWLKKKKWNRQLTRFGSLSMLEKGAFYCNLCGVPLLFVSLILGVIRASAALPNFSWLDPKVITSFIILGVYGYYLYQKLGKNVYGRPLVFWNTTAFLLILINVFLSQTITSFHLW